ncbi:hypothetical protein SLNWT_3312 [Streptomyces albus]|uniref:Uncharacterized protein n=1 Tax=Streptomyces albus (strain ATCC 21838 / DSM 41398 / FERM P-419 / JCM 4703 / NBRC 107858) TaxID=1081613 RepID=A0A0B5EMI5_STRA4|nr:hypothetical protein SLNWT_3312 [Streptomyces albus]
MPRGRSRRRVLDIRAGNAVSSPTVVAPPRGPPPQAQEGHSPR